MVHSRNRSQFLLLHPSRYSVPKHFKYLEVSKRRYDDLLAEMQRFRGRVYADDGAVRPNELTADGRHRLAVDDCSWHLLSINEQGQVCGCLRYLEETCARGFDDVWVRHAAISQSPVGWQFRRAVEQRMADARRQRLGFGEVGGWAVAEDRRWTLEPLQIILATYGLLELLGGCTGVATATFRHRSAMILRHIGLSSLCADGMELPPYFDARYGCEMEVLTFDSRFPNPKYREWVTEFSSMLTCAPVICSERTAARTYVMPVKHHPAAQEPPALSHLLPVPLMA